MYISSVNEHRVKVYSIRCIGCHKKFDITFFLNDSDAVNLIWKFWKIHLASGRHASCFMRDPILNLKCEPYIMQRYPYMWIKEKVGMTNSRS